MKGTYLKAKGGSARVLAAVTAAVLSLGLSGLALTAAGPAPAQAATSTVSVYRLYNKHSGEHFYTAKAGERDHLRAVGWNYEGVGWTATSTGTPVYRIYNPRAKGGDHYYTTKLAVAAADVSKGWRWDNDRRPVFYSPTGGSRIPVMAAYNRDQFAHNHNLTIQPAEQSHLVHLGWRNEGTAWYAVKPAYWGDSKAKSLTSLSNVNNIIDSNSNVWSGRGNYQQSKWVVSGREFSGNLMTGMLFYTEDDEWFTFTPAGTYQNFSGRVIVDDSSDSVVRLSVVISDPISSKILWTSSVLQPGGSQSFNLNIAGHNQLKIDFVKHNSGWNWGYMGIYNGMFR